MENFIGVGVSEFCCRCFAVVDVQPTLIIVVVMVAVNLLCLPLVAQGPVLLILLGEPVSNRICDRALGVSVTAKWLATT